MHVIKPSTHLAYVFDDEISREIGFELVFVLERIMELRERHTASFEPAVHHLIDAFICDAIDIERYFIYPWTVVVVQTHTREFLELIVTTDYLHEFLAGLVDAFPYRHSRRPKSVAGNIPIRCLFDGLLEPPAFHMCWKPIDRTVLLEHLLALAIYIHEPRRVSTIHQSGAATVTMRIAVAIVIDLPYYPTLFECFSDRLVRFPYVLPLPFAFGIMTVLIDDVYYWNLFLMGKFEVLFTICGSQMHDTGTMPFDFSVDVWRPPHFVGVLTTIDAQQRFVFEPYKLFCHETTDKFWVFTIF